MASRHARPVTTASAANGCRGSGGLAGCRVITTSETGHRCHRAYYIHFGCRVALLTLEGRLVPASAGDCGSHSLRRLDCSQQRQRGCSRGLPSCHNPWTRQMVALIALPTRSPCNFLWYKGLLFHAPDCVKKASAFSTYKSSFG